jgi:ribosomal protein S18 acetylase RimI-like enzyme
MVRVRLYASSDREFLLELAPRLAIGMPPWLDPARMVSTAQMWIVGSIEKHGTSGAVFVAEDDHGERMGFATVSRGNHFTGEVEAYIGELATDSAAEGRGVGTALVAACEEWSRGQGFRVLALSTGAANIRALGFYRNLGFHDEDIRLVKLLR